ncbi:helix-turn-helix domain-containing protein [Dickeya fangzhongdai]|uniref:PucR family transcriptional regulator n=1 Tax=Dickeya fangzhongdai TaxID=1778540 RepID=UPI001EFBCDB6|nr:helix-turn-helix domain-containing protein [Dickeya fangzhongdai]ULR30333.1 helix-turn-helix domain-containing protein [Dickeya fangzhongdai]
MPVFHHRNLPHHHTESEQDRWRSDFLLQLLTCDHPDLPLLNQRAARLQLPLDRPHRVTAWRLSGMPTLFSPSYAGCPEAQLHGARQQLQQQLQELVSEYLPPVMLGDLCLLALPADSPLLRRGHQDFTAFRQAINVDIAPLTLFGGISGPINAAEHYRRGLSEARQALNAAESMRPEKGLCDYTDLGVLQLLTSVSDPTLLTRFMHDALGNLVENNRKSPHLLIETLDAVLQENGNLIKAAERLTIHRNTLHQRLQRIEQLSGGALNDPLFRLNASVALLVWRLSGSQTQGTAIPSFKTTSQE